MAKTLTLIVNSDSALTKAYQEIGERYAKAKFLKVRVDEGKDRTLPQNALIHAMYERIAAMTGIGDCEDARRHCKLHYGVPILRRDSEDFRAGWDRIFKWLTYDEKLALMGPCAMLGPTGYPVTSLFTRAQGAEYVETIAAEFAQQGVVFTDLLQEAS